MSFAHLNPWKALPQVKHWTDAPGVLHLAQLNEFSWTSFLSAVPMLTHCLSDYLKNEKLFFSMQS